MKKLKIAIFASGNGSNAVNILRYFNGNKFITAELLITNNKNAGVVDKSHSFGVNVKIFTNDAFTIGEDVLNFLEKNRVDYIVLAGFLRKIPELLVNHFPNKIINIHPSLLPKYGGKGMYGMNVHDAVRQSSESRSGITIHTIDKNYDEGNYIAQFFTKIDPEDNAFDIEKKVRKLELAYFPCVIENFILINSQK